MSEMESVLVATSLDLWPCSLSSILGCKTSRMYLFMRLGAAVQKLRVRWLFWNIHKRVENELPRTNNSVEGWHRKMQAAVAADHPNIWRFINVLKSKHGFHKVVIGQRLGGHAIEPPKKNIVTPILEF